MSKVVIAVDFDGTLVDRALDGTYVVVEGAAAALQQLRDRGAWIVIYSCRTGIAAKKNGLRAELNFMADLLTGFGIPFDDIFPGEKLVADFYIDDRSISFQGDWSAALQAVDDVSQKLGP